ncbi:MAG: hypothetical protein H0V96_03245 [Acidimicrobiia bacterium]|nr:hypothetical protein [Acidimicrobiia bacterium]
MGRFEPERILEVLAEHGVQFVVVGGLAAALHGVPHVTFDIDITPATDRDNLDRLSAALTDLGARIRTSAEPAGLVFEHDGTSLASGQIWNLVTAHGDLDLTMMPSGTAGYPELVADAVETNLGAVRVAVASLEAVIRSKRAADRPKDRAVLPLMEQTLKEVRRRSRPTNG